MELLSPQAASSVVAQTQAEAVGAPQDAPRRTAAALEHLGTAAAAAAAAADVTAAAVVWDPGAAGAPGQAPVGWDRDGVPSPPFAAGTVPRTLTDEWAREASKRLDSMPREAGPNVVMNPISRQNYSRE
eukprot:SM000085S23233  [mRNA]  locus=s85:216942:217590:+ [translate_table: standard]